MGPLVSIILPAHNDAKWIDAAISSARQQTLSSIEIICVDDSSTDATFEKAAEHQQRDSRVRLIKHDHNRSAFQARRTGVFAAEAHHVLFLDGDDELAPFAAERAYDVAASTGADLVGFGISILDPSGEHVTGYERHLQPEYDQLKGNVLSGLFPPGRPAQGQLPRYLFTRSALRSAYTRLHPNLVLHRAEDLPVAFLVAAESTHYASLRDRLYTYHFGRGRSGRNITNVNDFAYYAGAISSANALGDAVRDLAATHSAPADLLACYRSARLWILSNILGYVGEIEDTGLRTACLARLRDLASDRELHEAAIEFRPEAIPLLDQ